MVSTTEKFTDNSIIPLSQYLTAKSPIARKSLYQVLEALDVKHNTDVGRLCSAKSKPRETISGNNLW